MLRRLYKKDKNKLGQPPGTLVNHGQAVEAELSVIAYNAEQIEFTSLDNFVDYKRDPNKITWFNLNNNKDVSKIKELETLFGIHPLVCEDINNNHQRPKFENWDSYNFVTVKMLSYNRDKKLIEAEQINFILMDKCLITIQENPGDVFEIVRNRLNNYQGRVRKHGADYLLYSLLDAITDHYFLVIDNVYQDFYTLEMKIDKSSNITNLDLVHNLRQEINLFKQMVMPIKEILFAIRKEDSYLIKQETFNFFRDLQDHTYQLLDQIETIKEQLRIMVDSFSIKLNNRLNEIMKTLTIISSIFIPLTFIVGVYGMNFKYMPEIDYKYSYPILMGIMVLIALIMLWFFKKKKWL